MHWPITVPAFTSSAANSVVVPCRLSSWVIVPARPFFIGSPGWVRSSAWICDFSSTDSTRLWAGGSRYSPTTSRSLAAKAGSWDSLKRRTRCGCRPCAAQIRCTERQRHHPVDQRRRQRRQAGLSGLVAQQASHPFAHEPLLPAPHAWLRDPGAPHNLRRATAFRCRQNDPRPPDMFLRAIAIRYNRCQSLAVRGAHLNADPLAHAASYEMACLYGIL